jgi:zinc transport system substrate-binding protein
MKYFLWRILRLKGENGFRVTLNMTCKMNKIVSGVVSLCLFLVLMCSKAPEIGTGQKTVFVTIPPQKFIVESIADSSCNVETLIPAGASPHTYEPKPSQMVQLAKAEVYFSIGVEMEKVWLPKIKAVNPDLRIIATDSGIVKLQPVSHHDHDEHHDGADPHIWLSPDLVRHQARIVADAFCILDTVHRKVYRNRLSLFEGRVDSVKNRVSVQLATCKAAKRFLVFHPSWAYFAQAFSLEQIAVESEGKEPSGRQLQTIVTAAREAGCTTILVQPQFSQKTARTIARLLGGTVAVADPMAENWAENLVHVAGILCKRMQRVDRGGGNQ